MLFFSTSVISFIFFLATFFSSAKLAAFVGPIALYVTILPHMLFLTTNKFEAIPAKKFCSIFPGTAFGFAAGIMSDYEYTLTGVNGTNAGSGDYSFNTAVGFLVLDTILYMVLAWYLDNVLPSQYGVAKPFYFLFQPSYWGGKAFTARNMKRRSSKFIRQSVLGQNDFEEDDESFEEIDDEGKYEPVTDRNLIPKVFIKNLVKRYPKNDFNSVDRLNLKLYENQITCLLGHNGAGKSSTISVLTGLYAPTSGDCSVYGSSISEELDFARESMGICPQHDVLFQELTVLEHLQFFKAIKGFDPSMEEMVNIARDVGLESKLNAMSGTLTGGMKRKLSVAIAFCGNPKFVLLDEPTSGMDPLSRRSLWDLLRKKKKDSVILLTTHYMEEAEILADRIAVMKYGQLQCVGTSLFLKRRFGMGYKLRVLMDSTITSNQPATSVSHDIENNDGNFNYVTSHQED